MNLIYFKSDIGNFGDDLNPWLWKKLLGNFSDYRDDVDFVGIGSILDSRILENTTNRKVIFGSGVRDFDFKIKKEDNVDIRFVRGPVTARLLDSNYITDSAYALRLLPQKNLSKKFKLSYIPYFRNYHNFNWKLLETFLGIHVINPCGTVEEVIEDIQSSEKILTTAMHGAILADLYRVPWMRVKFTKNGYESSLTSELKWNDWLGSIGLGDIPTHHFDYHLNSHMGRIDSLLKTFEFYKKFRSNFFILSDEKIILTVDDKINQELYEFKKKYSN